MALMYVGACLTLLGVILSFAMTDDLEEQVAEDNPSLTASEVEDAVSIGQALGVLFGAIGIGLWIWMAIMNRQGKSWARVTGTVFGAINVVFSLISLVVPGRAVGAGVAVTAAGMGLAVLIIVLMYQRDASAYYRMMSQPAWTAYPHGGVPPYGGPQYGAGPHPGHGPGGPGGPGPWGPPQQAPPY